MHSRETLRCQGNLPQVVHTLHASGELSHLHHGRQKQGDQAADDRDDDKNFD
jgi:hypothetical protein